MGIESYSITITAKDVDIVREREYWRLSGNSDISTNSIEQYFTSISKLKMREWKHWIYDNCIEIYLNDEAENFKGLELKGCISYFDEGIEECYKFIKDIEHNLLPVNVYILNEKVELNCYDDFYNKIKALYYDKIKIFKGQYNGFHLKVTCGDFYKEMKRRRGTLYKIKQKVSFVRKKTLKTR